MLLSSLNLYLVFVAEILAVSSGNEMLGCVYHIRVTDVYRVFITFFILNIEFHICFRLKYRWSFIFVIESQNILLFNVTSCYVNYSTTRLKISLKVSYQFMEKDIQTRVEVTISYIVLGKKKLKLLITPQNRFINQNNTWLYC